MNNKIILWAANNPRNEIAQMVLAMADEIDSLQNQLANFKNVAWVRVNDRGDLYDIRLHKNPYVEQATVLPLYVNRSIKDQNI